MADETRSRPVVVAAAVALAAAVVGGFALYVSGQPSGNSTTVATSGAGDAECAAKAGRAEAVAAAATGEVAAMLAVKPPVDLGHLAFNGPEGAAMSLADRAGKTVLVNLWATWCAPCRAEMPELDALQKEKGGAGFEVMAINVDTGDDEKPKKFLAETNVTALAYYSDHTMGVFNDLKKRGLALGLPVSLLIDGEGCLLAHMNGPAAWASADAKRLIDAAGS